MREEKERTGKKMREERGKKLKIKETRATDKRRDWRKEK